MTATVETTEITDVLDRFYAGWAAYDADAMAAVYAEDVTVVLVGASHQGRATGREYLARGFAGPLKGSRGMDTPRSIRVIDGHTAIVVSDAGILFPGEDSVPADRQRVATWTLSKQDGEWLVAAYANTPAH